MKVFVRFGKNVDSRAAEKIASIIVNKSINVVSDTNKIKINKESIKNTNSNFIIVIGDDSDILMTCNEIYDKIIPVLPISFDTYSFFAQSSVENLPQILDALLENKFTVQKSLRLMCSVEGKNFPPALNDAVIISSRGGTGIRYTLTINGEEIWRDYSDGVIVSTPTGSTGYSLSAGGPILNRNVPAFVITPISSSSRNKPLVIPIESRIEINKISSRVSCDLVLDGSLRVGIREKAVTITKGDSINFVNLSDEQIGGVIKRLRKKVPSVKKELTPSAKFVFRLLVYEGPLTQKELVESSGLEARTIRNALKLLSEGKLVERSIGRDARQSVYRAVGV